MIIFYAFFFTTFSAMIIYRSILYFKSLYHYKVESTGFCLKVVKLGFFIEVVTKKNDVPVSCCFVQYIVIYGGHLYSAVTVYIQVLLLEK